MNLRETLEAVAAGEMSVDEAMAAIEAPPGIGHNGPPSEDGRDMLALVLTLQSAMRLPYPEARKFAWAAGVANWLMRSPSARAMGLDRPGHAIAKDIIDAGLKARSTGGRPKKADDLMLRAAVAAASRFLKREGVSTPARVVGPLIGRTEKAVERLIERRPEAPWGEASVAAFVDVLASLDPDPREAVARFFAEE